MLRCLCHLVPRAGAGERFRSQVDERVGTLRAGVAGQVEVALLWRVDDDALGGNAPWRAALELRTVDASTTQLFEHSLRGLGAEIEAVAHPDLSTALVGRDHVFIDPQRSGPPAAVRYQYLMRRRADFTHATYLERYQRVHSRFGMRTPGVTGYVQLHVDTDASQQLARRAGLGTWDVDSVSELYMESIGGFLSAVADSTAGADAIADEQRFVDRPRSFGLSLCSDVHGSSSPAARVPASRSAR